MFESKSLELINMDIENIDLKTLANVESPI